jgi:signal peptidase I, bacterial type
MEQQKSKKDLIIDEAISFLKISLFSFVFIYLMQAFFFKPIHVEGDSMYPTLHNNDMGFTNVISRNIGGIERFDVVIIYMPATNKYLVKRVIGLPGETISYSGNKLYVNGVYVEEPFLNQAYIDEFMLGIDGYFTSDFGPIVLGEDEYFVLGDNRRKSSDSRFYGAFSASQIIGKGVLILYPFNHIVAR